MLKFLYQVGRSNIHMYMNTAKLNQNNTLKDYTKNENVDLYFYVLQKTKIEFFTVLSIIFDIFLSSSNFKDLMFMLDIICSLSSSQANKTRQYQR